MPLSSSIVPESDKKIFLVLEDFGYLGRAWRETRIEDSDVERIITDLLKGRYTNPVRLIAFNTSEGWSRDVSEDVARELQQRRADQMHEIPAGLQQFVARYGGIGRLKK
jgi:hypothetical protein